MLCYQDDDNCLKESPRNKLFKKPKTNTGQEAMSFVLEKWKESRAGGTGGVFSVTDSRCSPRCGYGNKINDG